MNWLHHWLCRSDGWRRTIEHRVPWVLGDLDLGERILEIGPGPGVTTDILRSKVAHLTVLELDPKLADSLRSRLDGGNVEVIAGSATAMPFSDSQFSAVASLNMLHHVPFPELQNRLLREVYRVLRPEGAFVGSDSRQGLLMQLIHIGDTLVPVDPDTFGERLEAAGFQVERIEKNREVFRFRARRPFRS